MTKLEFINENLPTILMKLCEETYTCEDCVLNDFGICVNAPMNERETIEELKKEVEERVDELQKQQLERDYFLIKSEEFAD